MILIVRRLLLLEKESFDNVANWISFAKNIEDCLIVIVGNKLDLERKVNTVDAEQLALKEGASFYEISSKTNENVFKTLFESISNFPYFTSQKLNKQKLVQELENENVGGLSDSPTTRNNININGEPTTKSVKANCKC